MHNIVCVCVCWNVSNVKVKCQIFTLQKCIEAFFYFQLLYLNSFQYSSSQLRSTKTCKWSQKQHQMFACRNFIRLNRSPFCVFSFGAVLTWLQNICRFKRMPCAFDSSKDWIDHFFSKKKWRKKQIQIVKNYYKRKSARMCNVSKSVHVHVHCIRNLVGFWVLLFCLIKFQRIEHEAIAQEFHAKHLIGVHFIFSNSVPLAWFVYRIQRHTFLHNTHTYIYRFSGKA